MHIHIRYGLLFALLSCLTCIQLARASSPNFTVGVSASPSTVQPKQSEEISITATANQTVSNYNIAAAITYQGIQVDSKSFTGVNFPANTQVAKSFSYSIPGRAALGTYTVTVNIKKNGTVYATASTTFIVGNGTVNGQCGSSNGADLTSAPTTNLCSAGTASAVTGTGPWNWSCPGSNGGSTASCSAQLEIIGVCGSANGVAVSTAPTTNLCSIGTSSSVTGSGPWDWTCAGSNGGSTASCSAPLASSPVNGQCGSANGTDVTSAPTTNLCSVGTASSVTGSGPFDWTCAGANGGTTASCSAQLEINGACGAANGVAVSSAPTSGLCSAGTTSVVTGTGPWDWSCAGSNGGTTASCSAPAGAINGACGSANGTVTNTAPTSGLCSTGTASAVTGTGPWDWSCAGSNGGTTASCSAAYGGSCPQGNTYVSAGDGCEGAQSTGSVQITNFFSGYTNGTGYAPQTGCNVGGHCRPAWNVAGVDYPVGYSGTLADPTQGGLPSCATLSGSGSGPYSVTVSGNCTISGFDFSLYNGICVTTSGTGNITLSNNRFAWGTNCNSGGWHILTVGNTAGTIMIKYNEFDGNETSSDNLGTLIGDSAGASTANVDVEYNALLDTDQGVIEPTAPGVTWNIAYNYVENIGVAPNHGDFTIPNNNSGTVTVDDTWNTVYGHIANATTLCYITASNNSGTITGSCNYETLVANPSNPSDVTVAYLVESSDATIGNFSANNNYMDWSGAYGPYASLGSPVVTGTITCTGNINLNTGGNATGTLLGTICN